jgi:hypothetical protein
MLKVTIGLISGESISVNYYDIVRYQDLIESWQFSKIMTGQKFINIKDINDEGRVITIYLPDIVFVDKKELDERGSNAL